MPDMTPEQEKEVLAKATPRPWRELYTRVEFDGVMTYSEYKKILCANDALVLLAVNSYEANQQRISALSNEIERLRNGWQDAISNKHDERFRAGTRIAELEAQIDAARTTADDVARELKAQGERLAAK